MTSHRPLDKTNPEFSTRVFPGYCEYRIENWHLARDGSGQVINGTSGFGWLDASVPIIAGILWKFEKQQWLFLVISTVLLLRLWFKCTQVLSESVVVLPPHGVQLETRRGLPSMCLSTTRQFIPLAILHDMIINEGLKGWDVRYYLAAIWRAGNGGFSLGIAFENIMPPHAVLLYVYYGVHKDLLRG